MSEAPVGPSKMIPDPDGRNADFYRHLATGRLHVQRCDACARALHPPRYLCPACGSEALSFLPASGRGTLFSWTVSHRPTDPAWATQGPWATVVVELEEGVRMVGGWRGSLDALQLDRPVVAEVEPAGEQFAFVYWRPAE